MPNHYSREGDNEDIAIERRSCPFDTRELAIRIHGSKKVVEDRRRILAAVEAEPALRNTVQDSGMAFMTRMEKFEQSHRNTVAAEKYMDRVIDRNDETQYKYFQELVNGTSGHPFALTHAIVIPLLESNADEEQRRLFLEPLKRHEFVSAYAQTELGHGTDTKMLETTATYDLTTEEFVLNTPTLTALKWWPGNLGKTASVVVVMATLWTKGKSYGMHPFVVRIRDEETHELLPGVVNGDMGPIFTSIYVNDNGYVGFKNFRVPRKSLLMKHFKVHPDGTYEAGIHSRIAYVGMMYVRATLVFDLGIALAAAATIATRYSVIRRQGEINPREGEVKVLDYKTQQYRILPQLARAVCFCFAGHYTMRLYNEIMDDVKRGDASKMAALHALSSGLKSVCSHQASIGAEQCRLSCGGHGYTMASGLPQIYTKTVAACTYEGDNLVMLLQLARYLAKCVAEVRAGKQRGHGDELIRYLYAKSPLKESAFNSAHSQERKWEAIEQAFEHLSRRLTFKAFDRFVASKKRDADPIAWNKTSVEWTKAARAHTRTFLSRNFIQTVVREQDPQIRRVLADLLDVYLYYELLECRADLIEDNYIAHSQLDQAREELNASLGRLRRNAVNIADSFDLPDRILCSVLGRRDGHVYGNLFEWAQKSELNRTPVLPFHHETLGRMAKEREFLRTSKL